MSTKLSTSIILFILNKHSLTMSDLPPYVPSVNLTVTLFVGPKRDEQSYILEFIVSALGGC